MSISKGHPSLVWFVLDRTVQTAYKGQLQGVQDKTRGKDMS